MRAFLVLAALSTSSLRKGMFVVPRGLFRDRSQQLGALIKDVVPDFDQTIFACGHVRSFRPAEEGSAIKFGFDAVGG